MKDKKELNLLASLAVAFSVIFSNNTLVFGTNANTRVVNLTMVATVLFAAVLAVCILLFRKHLSVVNTGLMLSMSVLLFLSALFNLDFRFGYVYKMALVVLAWGIAEHISLQKFAMIYDNVMIVLSVVSLVGIVLYYAYPALLQAAPILENTVGFQFYNLILCTVPKFYYGFPRNYGIFREPGVFQMYLVVAMLFHLTVLPKVSIWKMVVYVVAVLTTLSTVGYVALVLLFILTMIRKEVLTPSIKKILGITIAMIAAFAFLVPDIRKAVLELTIGKLDVNGAAGESSISRYASVIVNLQLWLKAPIFGAGITEVAESFTPLAGQLFEFATPDNSNMLLIQFAQHGLFYGLLWVAGYVRGAWKLGSTILERLLIMAIFLILLMCQNYNYSLITMLLLFFFTSDLRQDEVRFSAQFDNPISGLLSKRS